MYILDFKKVSKYFENNRLRAKFPRTGGWRYKCGRGTAKMY